MTKRIFNDNGAFDRETLDHIIALGVDAVIKSAYQTLVEAGYESRDSEAYLREMLGVCAAQDRVFKAIERRRVEREAGADGATQ